MSMTAEEGTADPMPPIRHILCCTDLSPASEPAWGEARLLARVVGADVLLLHVVPLLVIPAEVYVPPTLSQEWIDAADREAQERLARLRDQSEGPAPVITRVEVGSAAEGILRVTRSTDVDLIVMGTHGRTGLSLVALGSVADRVVRLAPCPVVTTRARSDRPMPTPERLSRICYATDFSACAEAAWPWAVTLAAAAGAEIDLLHVTPAVGERDLSTVEIGRMAQALREHGEAQAQRLIQASSLPRDRVHVWIASGKPTDEIIRSTGARSADLIVVGTHGYLLALAMGIRMSFQPLHMLGVLGFIVLGAALFSTLSLIIACLVKTRERFMGIGQVLTMPIVFASNAIYPLALMPRWLHAVSRANPLTYQVDALRALMLPRGVALFGVAIDAAVLMGTFAAVVTVAARLYPRMVT